MDMFPLRLRLSKSLLGGMTGGYTAVVSFVWGTLPDPKSEILKQKTEPPPSVLGRSNWCPNAQFIFLRTSREPDDLSFGGSA